MRQLTKRIQRGAVGFSWSTLLPSISAGIVIGILMIFIGISFAAMIFSGPLTSFIAQGIGLMLFGLAFHSLLGAIFSSFESTHHTLQDGPVALLAVISATIVNSSSDVGNIEGLFLTVVAVIALTTFLTGVFFLLVGKFQLGNLVRYIPFPVVGGFLAGAGWLLVTGSIGVMVDVTLGPEMLQGDVLWRWLPGFIFALTLLVVLQFDTPFWTLPSLLFGGVAAFYIGYGLINGEVHSAEANGWLLGPFPDGSMWQPHLLDVLTEANWELVLGQLPDIGTVILVSLITFLLNVGALAVAAERDIDMNHELQALGIINVVGSLAAVSVGYTSVSLSTLAFRLARNSRLVSVIVAILAAFALLVGASFLNFFPRIIAGGFLLFLGLTFIKEWLISVRNKVPRLEFMLMWVIVLMVVFLGFLEAVFAGILISTVLFAINYSQTPTTRLALTAESLQSKVQRPLLYQQLLRQRGEKIQIYTLQGYIFFGVGDNLRALLNERLAEATPEFVLLDFRLVTGIDSSAMLSLSKIKQLTVRRSIQLVLTGLQPVIETRLRNETVGDGEGKSWHIFSELDEGVAWCEEQLIADWESVGLAARPESIRRQWMKLVKDEGDEKVTDDDVLAALSKGQSNRRRSVNDDDHYLARLNSYLVQRDLWEGETLVQGTERFNGLILVEEGQLRVNLAAPDGKVIQEKMVEAGNIVGELGQYSRRTIRLTAVAEEPATIFLLTAEKIEAMEVDDPALAIALHRLVTAQLSERNLQLDEMSQALL